MMNRRQFRYSTSAALLARPWKVYSQTIDMIIEGGRVIDPSLRVEGRSGRQRLFPSETVLGGKRVPSV